MLGKYFSKTYMTLTLYSTNLDIIEEETHNNWT